MRFEGALGRLNESYFFREFTFSTNTFKPNRTTQLELADALVWLDDFLIVVQAKERYASFGASLADESNWFQKEVMGKAVSQIRNTLQYLNSYDSIELSNNQGHAFNLANAKNKRTHKLVLYHTKESVPEDCASRRFVMDSDAGIVHVISSDDYHGILETLITPAEVEQYMSFREELVGRWGERVCRVSEQALIGHFLRNLPGAPPSAYFATYATALQRKAGETDKWDISNIIHLFPKRRNTPQRSPTDYYRILRELAILKRTDMGAFKERFFHSMELANKNEAALPNRFVASTGCGFVFVPLQREQMSDRRHALQLFTRLHKYDSKIDRCIGLTFISEGNEKWCDVQWTRVEHPWEENDELAAALAKINPFRPMKTTVQERYGLSSLE
jgi:hypothetical protein